MLDYADERAQGRERLRAAVVAAADRLLATEGAPAVTMRRVADLVGATTGVLYSQFGGKHGVIEAVYRQGFADLAAAFGSVGTDGDPVAVIAALTGRYVDFARTHPWRYRVMFSEAVPGFTASEAARAEALTVLAPLVAAIDRARAAGLVAVADPAAAAQALWAAVHGPLALELAGFFPPEAGDALTAEVLATTLRGWGAGPRVARKPG